MLNESGRLSVQGLLFLPNQFQFFFAWIEGLSQFLWVLSGAVLILVQQPFKKRLAKNRSIAWFSFPLIGFSLARMRSS
jgi:hypothetical protein